MNAPFSNPCRLGFAGVGLMGHGMARNALRAGHAVALLLHSEASRARCADLLALGAQAVATAAELAAAAELLVVCVTDSPQVEAVVLGPQGLLAGLRPGTVVLDCSTSLPESTRRVAAAVQAAGGQFLDAALTGTPKEAEEGTVNLLVGGDEALLDRLRPVLASFARHLYFCGPVGAGHTVKLLHQFVVLGNAAVLAEAFSCATKAGAKLDTLCEVIASGGANSTAFQRLRPYVTQGDDQGFRFTLGNALKDMRYYTQMASDARVVAGVAGAVQASYVVAHNAGLGGAFVPHLLDSLHKMNGCTPPAPTTP